MELKQALSILAQLANESQVRGVLTLDEAVLVKQARDTALAAIQEIEKEEKINVQTEKEENDGN